MLALIVYLYAFAKGDQADPKLIFSLGAISQLFFVVIIMGPLTYVTGVANWPLQDHALLAIDRAMGMDPEVIARYVNDHDWLGGLLLRAYGLIKIMLLAVPVVLTLTLRLVRLQVFVFAFSIALIITVAISTFVPAVGTWYGLNIAPSQFASLDSSLYTAQLRDIQACARARCAISKCSSSPASCRFRASTRPPPCSTCGRCGRCVSSAPLRPRSIC